MIPKTIHYCWFGQNPIPNSLRKCIQSWEKLCPDYTIIKWDENNFDISVHPFMEAAYKAKSWAFVSDYARLKIVYEQGGIYLDTDVELIKNIDFLLSYKMFIGVQQAGKLCTTGLGFGAEKNNSVVYAMMKLYDALTFDEENRDKLSCPILNNSVLEKMGYVYSEEVKEIDSIAILPCRMMDPVAPGKTEDLFCDETISIHHYSASWDKRLNRIKRKIFLLIGQRRVNNIKNKMLFWRSKNDN